MYIVVNNFVDLVDNNHNYKKGSLYPFEQKEVEEGRIEELSTKQNKQKKVLIKKIEKLDDLTVEQLIEYASIEKIDLKDTVLNEINLTLENRNKSKDK